MLACAARDGDRDALRRLLLRNWPWLKAIALGVLGSAGETDDCLQDICLRVIEKVNTLREPELFKPWLAVLARRQALTHRRRLDKDSAISGDDLTEHQCRQNLVSPIEDIERKEQCSRILKVVAGLPEKYREVFMLAHAGDLTYRQIAEILDVPVTTMQIRLVRARKMILEALTGKAKDRVAGK